MGETFWMGIIGILLSGLLTANFFMLRQINQKVTSVCVENKEEHEAIYERIHHHRHTEEGEVVITA
jgi:uridylate kinase